MGCKNGPVWVEGESALDRHNNGTESEAHNAYIFVTNGWDTDENDNIIKPVSAEFALDATYGNPDGFYTEVPIKCLYDEALEVYPDNEPVGADEGIATAEGYGWWDSGWEYQAAKLFVTRPELYRNYVEFTLEAPAKVWMGIKKDVNAPSQYWMPWRDLRLEVKETAGIESVNVENAPVEYFNIQGMRVAEPTTGIYIVKQGQKVTKQVIR